MSAQYPLYSTTGDLDVTLAPSEPAPYAGWWRRVAASVLDSALILVVLLATVLAVPAGDSEAEAAAAIGWIAIVFFAVLFLYEPVAHGFFGRTVGKRAMGIRLLTVGREKVGFGRALWRQVTKLFLGAIPLLGLLDPLNALISKQKQTVHDAAARTIVVIDR